MNIKRIPYRTEWISYPDIKPTLIKFNETSDSPGLIDPSDPDTYTLPVIRILAPDATKYKYKYIKDSVTIAQYLDQVYPSTPPLFPPYTRALQSGFQDSFRQHVTKHLATLLIASQIDKLESQAAKDYYLRSREEWMGHPIGEFCPPGSDKEKEAWEGMTNGIKTVGSLLTRYGWNEGEKDEDKGWVMGAVGPTWIDIATVSVFLWFEKMGPDGGWKRITDMEGAEWVKKLWDNMGSYMEVV